MVAVADVLDLVKGITGCDKPVTAEDARKRPPESEVMALMADASRFRDATGWAPAVTLEEGLKRTVAWWRDRMDRTRPDTGYRV